MAASPTGRTPRLLWTSARQDVWNQMKADYDANPTAPTTLGGKLYKYAKAQADDDGFTYQDQHGLWPTILFQITGDTTYAARAFAKLQLNTFWTHPAHAYRSNAVREAGQIMPLMYDWLYPALTTQQRSDFATRMNALADDCVNGKSTPPIKPAMNTYVGDTDQVTGEYTAVGMWAAAAGDEYPQAVTWFNTIGGTAVSPEYLAQSPPGHLFSAGTPPTDARNAMYYYIGRQVAGGEWHEGSHYNLGTSKLWIWGVEALKTFYTPSHFAETDTWYQGAAKQRMFYASNDLEHSIQYGDVENPHPRAEMNDYHWINLSMMLAGVTQGTAIGPYLQQHTIEHCTKKGMPFGPINVFPQVRAWMLFNPYAATDNYEEVGLTFYAEGQGQMVVKDSWESSGSMAWFMMMPANISVHHKVDHTGSFQVYRRGHWALTAPQAYGSTLGPVESSAQPGAVNSLRMIGFCCHPPNGGASGTWPIDAIDSFARVWSTTTSEYGYLCGTYGGQIHPQGMAYFPPPTCFHEFTRSFIKLNSVNGESDVIVICDRTNCEDPEALPSFDRYAAQGTLGGIQANKIQNALARKEWFFFSNQAPLINNVQATHAQTFTDNPGTIRWTDAGGDPVQIETLLPANINKLVQNWNTIAPASWSGTERQYWRTTVYPVTDQQWDVVLNVVSAYNNGTVAPVSTLITGTENMKGVRVVRSGEDDRVVMFNGTQGANLPAQGQYTTAKGILDVVRFQATAYSFAYTQTTASCKVIVCDHSPSVTWTYTINGGASQALTVDSKGLGEFAVSGTGAKTIVFNGAGDPPPPPENEPGVKRAIFRVRLKLRVTA